MRLSTFKSSLICYSSGLLFGLGMVGQAHATAVSEASVQIDWSSLSVTTQSASPNSSIYVEVDSFLPVNYAEVYSDNTIDFQSDFADTNAAVDISSAVEGTSANAQIDSSTISVATASAGTGMDSSAYSESYAFTDALVFAEGIGSITFEVDFMVMALAATEQLGESAWTIATALLGLEDDLNLIAVEAEEFIFIDAHDGDSVGSEDYITGSLSITQTVNGTFTGLLYGGASAYSDQISLMDIEEVPLPGTLVLMLIGLAGLLKRPKLSIA